MRKHWLFVLSVLVVAVIGTMVMSSAQERQMGGAGITVVTNSNFRGKSATFLEDVSELVRHGLNDKISSLRVSIPTTRGGVSWSPVRNLGNQLQLCLKLKVDGTSNRAEAVVYRNLQKQYSLTGWTSGECTKPAKTEAVSVTPSPDKPLHLSRTVQNRPALLEKLPAGSVSPTARKD
jgi:hypothetical protein